jgi:hypothetical protein
MEGTRDRSMSMPIYLPIPWHAPYVLAAPQGSIESIGVLLQVLPRLGSRAQGAPWVM